jgi:putative ABC transport system ATP-binding protein
MTQAVEIQDLSYAFGTAALRRFALLDLNLTFAPGEIVPLAGPSGSGKTTLMALIGALRAVQTGSCVVLGRELSGAGERDRIAIRRQVGLVFQDHRLLSFLTAAQNVATSLAVDPMGSERDRMRRAVAVLDAVGLADYANTRPGEVSGGQRRRVATARALVRDPGLILADEPPAALDRQSGADITHILCELAPPACCGGPNRDARCPHPGYRRPRSDIGGRPDPPSKSVRRRPVAAPSRWLRNVIAIMLLIFGPVAKNWLNA